MSITYRRILRCRVSLHDLQFCFAQIQMCDIIAIGCFYGGGGTGGPEVEEGQGDEGWCDSRLA